MPAGARHPFAEAMIQHFNNLQTPLKSIHKYPSLNHQRRRFHNAGWPSSHARTLWDLWSDNSVVSAKQKSMLDAVEPFDEWEEFILFASHYFILEACKTSCDNSFLLYSSITKQGSVSPELAAKAPAIPTNIKSKSIPTTNKRRFGAVLPISHDVLGHHGGLGSKSRLQTLDFYGLAGCQTPNSDSLLGIQPRMCHSITAAGEDMNLLVGGRTSPAKALKDCWILGNQQQRVEDLPMNLYRHCACYVEFESNFSGVIVYGGKNKTNEVSDKWLLWRSDSATWVHLDIISGHLQPRFGATMTMTSCGKGVLIGGMNAENVILSEMWEWSIMNGDEGLYIALRSVHISDEATNPSSHGSPKNLNVLGRIGACLISSPFGILLVGGMCTQISVQDFDIYRLSKVPDTRNDISNWSLLPFYRWEDVQRPLLVGHSAFSFHDSIAIVGGGATCFSFGTYWNEAMTILFPAAGSPVCLMPLRAAEMQSHPLALDGQVAPAAATTIPTTKSTKLQSAQEFENMVAKGQPTMINGSQLGPCTTDWDLETLKTKIGPHRQASFPKLI